MTYVKEDIHAPSHACQRKLPQACTEQEKPWSYPEKTGQLTQRGHEYSKQVYFAKCLLWWRWRSASGSAAGPGKKSEDGNLHVLWEMPRLTLPAVRMFTAPTRIALYFQPNPCHKEGCLEMLVAIKAICRGKKGFSVLSNLTGETWGKQTWPTPFPWAEEEGCAGLRVLPNQPKSFSLALSLPAWHRKSGLGIDFEG